MRRVVGKIVLLGCIGLVASAEAWPPSPGIYRSSDLGGDLLPGRDLEGWAAGASLLSGVTVNMYSWKQGPYGPIEHGAQWLLRCVDESGPAVLVADSVDGSGNGYRRYERPFNVASSFLQLGLDGPWSGGSLDVPLFGTLDSYTDQVTIQYVDGAPAVTTLGARADGHLWYYPGYLVSFEIGQGALVATGPPRAIYPWVPAFFYQPGCTPTTPGGAYWELTGITIRIDGDPVPAQSETWGRLKSRYR